MERWSLRFPTESLKLPTHKKGIIVKKKRWIKYVSGNNKGFEGEYYESLAKIYVDRGEAVFIKKYTVVEEEVTETRKPVRKAKNIEAPVVEEAKTAKTGK